MRLNSWVVPLISAPYNADKVVSQSCLFSIRYTLPSLPSLPFSCLHVLGLLEVLFLNDACCVTSPSPAPEPTGALDIPLSRDKVTPRTHIMLAPQWSISGLAAVKIIKPPNYFTYRMYCMPHRSVSPYTNN